MEPINKMSPIHPGEILREEFLVPLKMTPHARALELKVPALRINDIARAPGHHTRYCAQEE
jgi:antitoxin HigA-1